jgi:hypothetical protein
MKHQKLVPWLIGCVVAGAVGVIHRINLMKTERARDARYSECQISLLESEGGSVLD